MTNLNQTVVELPSSFNTLVPLDLTRQIEQLSLAVGFFGESTVLLVHGIVSGQIMQMPRKRH